MTLFEYLAIAFSLVFSFCGARLVSGLPHALQPERRYWVHLGFVVWQLFVTVFIFWVFWSFREVHWDFVTFALVLSSPGLVYFNACTLVPENPSTVDSWRDYFYEVRRRYFVGVCCWGLALVAISTVALGMPLVHPGRAIQAATLGVGVVGFLSDSHRVQAVLAVVVLLVSALMSVTLGLQPGSFAP